MKFVMGFELEFYTKLEQSQVKRSLKKLGVQCKIDTDSSLDLFEDPTGEYNDEYYPYGFEIITPPLPEKEALENLNLALDWIAEHGATDDSCGFHVNISYPGIKKINQLDLINEYWDVCEDSLKRWDRTKNIYCRPFSHYLKLVEKGCKKIESRHRLLNSTKEEILADAWTNFVLYVSNLQYDQNSDYINKATNQYDTKHICCNVGYIVDRGYLEFRTVGGCGYHQRRQEIRFEINEIKKVLKNVVTKSNH